MGAKNTTPVIDIRKRRNSYDSSLANLPVRGGKFRKESSNSLPSSLEVRQPFTKYRGFYPGGPKTKKSNIKSSAETHFKTFNYESDFEPEDEEKGLPNDAASRMRYLKKKRDTMWELERKIAERDAHKEREARIRKYKELEQRHSGNSLQITKPNEDPIHYGRFTKPSPRPSPQQSPDRQRKPFNLSLPKSKSNDKNLSENASHLERRPSSLERLEGNFSKMPFSRAPTQQQQQQQQQQQRRVIRARGKVPTPLAADTPSSRRSTPGIGLGRYSDSMFSRNSPYSSNLLNSKIAPPLGPLRAYASETNLSTIGNSNGKKSFSKATREPTFESRLILGGAESELLKSYLTNKNISPLPKPEKYAAVKKFESNKVMSEKVPEKVKVVKPPSNTTTISSTSALTAFRIPKQTMQNGKPNPVKPITLKPLNPLPKETRKPPPQPPPPPQKPPLKKAKSGYFEISMDDFNDSKASLNSKNTQPNKSKPPPKKLARKPTLPSSTRAQSSVPPSSVIKGEKVNEDDLPTACFKKPRILNTIQGKSLRPLPKPGEIYSDTIELLKSDEWEDSVEGIETIVRMVTFHPEYILRDLKEINALLMQQVKNLRSQVCRAALQAITHFFICLKKSMEQDLDKLVALLLSKTSDTNKFLKEDSNCALDAMIEVTSPSKSVAALIQAGIGHRNPQVRTTVGRLLAYTTELLGAGKVLNQKDVADKLLPAAARLAQEGSLETRQMAKLIFQRLATQPQFDSSLRKYVSSEDVRQIQKFLDNLYTDNRKEAPRTKGGRFASKGR